MESYGGATKTEGGYAYVEITFRFKEQLYIFFVKVMKIGRL